MTWKLNPPATPQEMYDLHEAIAHQIPLDQMNKEYDFLNSWAPALIALRRGYQERFVREAQDEEAYRSQQGRQG